MASAIIHLAIAKVLEPYFKIDNKKDYYLGAIAPDISKQIKQEKTKSHFLYNTKGNIPNITMYTNKYPRFQDNSFNLGYYIHLYADKIWFDEFLEKIIYGNSIHLLDGTILKTEEEEINALIYQDYTNLNIQIIDEYNFDLSLFYEEFSLPKTNLNDIPIEKLNLLIDQMGIIIENSKIEKNYLFDIYLITEYIEKTKNLILNEIEIPVL